MSADGKMLALMNYSDFLKSKTYAHQNAGIKPKSVNQMLFDFQRDIVKWALRKGRAAIFADCGLGKSFMQLEWAKQVPGRVLILAPLAVAPQTVREGTKLNIEVTYSREPSDAQITITNYADYLVTMRKPGINTEPVHHTNETFPVQVWQNYASPVWMDINPSNTLNKVGAREEDDERHICPLQLDVIERAIRLWTNPGDIVFSPFAGIGSEGYQAIKMGREFMGCELKESYFLEATANLNAAELERNGGLFADMHETQTGGTE